MTKPKNDYPGRVPRIRATQEQLATLPNLIIEALTREPKRSAAELAMELPFSANTILARLHDLELEGRTKSAETPGATVHARKKTVWSLGCVTPIASAKLDPFNDPLMAALFGPARREAA